jgi:hypothetical protein
LKNVQHEVEKLRVTLLAVRPKSPAARTALHAKMSGQYMSLSIARLSGCNLLSNARLQGENLLSNPPGLPALRVVVETNDWCINPYISSIVFSHIS